MNDLREIYPGFVEPFRGYGPDDCQPLLNSIGEIVIQVDDDSGWSRILFRSSPISPGGISIFGLLVFYRNNANRWLRSCETYDDIKNLRRALMSEIAWETAPKMWAAIKYRDKDLNIDWNNMSPENLKFVKQSLDYLWGELKEKWFGH